MPLWFAMKWNDQAYLQKISKGQVGKMDLPQAINIIRQVENSMAISPQSKCISNFLSAGDWVRVILGPHTSKDPKLHMTVTYGKKIDSYLAADGAFHYYVTRAGNLTTEGEKLSRVDKSERKGHAQQAFNTYFKDWDAVVTGKPARLPDEIAELVLVGGD